MKFDDNIAFPKPHTRTHYLGKMTVGQSFFLKGHTTSSFTSASKYSRRHPGWRFTVRQVEENGVKGIRCWCLACPPKEPALRIHKIA